MIRTVTIPLTLEVNIDLDGPQGIITSMAISNGGLTPIGKHTIRSIRAALADTINEAALLVEVSDESDAVLRHELTVPR